MECSEAEVRVSRGVSAPALPAVGGAAGEALAGGGGGGECGAPRGSRPSLMPWAPAPPPASGLGVRAEAWQRGLQRGRRGSRDQRASQRWAGLSWPLPSRRGKQLCGEGRWPPAPGAGNTCLAPLAAALWTQQHPSPAQPSPWPRAASTSRQSLFWDCFFLETGSWGVSHSFPQVKAPPRAGQAGGLDPEEVATLPCSCNPQRPREPQVPGREVPTDRGAGGKGAAGLAAQAPLPTCSSPSTGSLLPLGATCTSPALGV